MAVNGVVVANIAQYTETYDTSVNEIRITGNWKSKQINQSVPNRAPMAIFVDPQANLIPVQSLTEIEGRTDLELVKLVLSANSAAKL